MPTEAKCNYLRIVGVCQQSKLAAAARAYAYRSNHKIQDEVALDQLFCIRLLKLLI